MAVKEIKLSEVLEQTDLRLEAEFWVADKNERNKFVTGEEIIDFVQYGTSEGLNENQEGFPILRLNEFSSLFLGTPAKYCDLIDRKTYESLKVKKGDVFICRTNGNPKLVGKSAFAAKDEDFAFASYLFRIRPKEEIINSETLMIYLNTKYGRDEIEKYSMVSNQANFSPAKFREIKIPVLPIELRNKISEIVKKAHAKLEESKALYAEAENLLLDELGLPDWSPSADSISVKSFAESFADTGRLDAEYYQPKYDYVLERLRNLTPKPLDIVPLESLIKEITNGGTPLRHNLSEGEIPFLTAEHIFDFRINYASEKRILSEHHYVDLKRTRLKQNDVLIAIKGKVGNAAVVDNPPFEANINQDVGLFRLKDGINPYYIAGFLNSIIGKAFVEQISTGQINPFLGLGNLKTLKIPVFETELMNELGGHLKEKLNLAYSISQQSKQLLDIAKRAVELAIEESEAAAVGWIGGQV